MKTHWTTAVLLCALAAAANAQTPDGKRPPTSPMGAPLMVLPISIQDDDHSTALNLRDALRQPIDTMLEPGSKPHRLSPEERHRLREQLRSQPGAELNKGKP